MRLLMLAPCLPYPADHGAAQRNLNLLKWLGDRHDVTLLTYGDPADERGRVAVERHARVVDVVALPKRRPIDRIATLGLSKDPDLARRLWSPAFVERLRHRLDCDTYDVVQVEGLEMFSLFAAAASARRPPPPVVLDEHNAEYRLQESAWQASLQQGAIISSAYSFVQAWRLRRFEQDACRAVDGVLAVSNEDAASLRCLGSTGRIGVIPNGVDTSFYGPNGGERDDSSILFIGKLDYRPNVDAVEWLCRDIWPRVVRVAPEARLSIVGRDPTEHVRRLGTTAGVQVVGPVGDDRVWFQRSGVLVVPMRMGGGVRLKVLQAMATGTPIVSTSIGMAGVGATPGTHYFAGETAEQFAHGIVRAVRDGDARRAVARASLAFVRARFDWQVILTRLDDFYRELREEREGN